MTYRVVTRLAVVAALATVPAARAPAVELRLTTENDLLTSDNRDDLYTFAVALSVVKGPYTFSWRENAFTDRQAGMRFDETHVTVRRAVPGTGRWRLEAEGGWVWAGRGLLGESAQNAVHRLLGQEELSLPYSASRLSPSLAVEVERPFRLADDFEVGPRLEAYGAPAFRSHAVAAGQARWQPGPHLAVGLLAGGRWSTASFAPLERHLAALAPLVRLEIVWRQGAFVSWTYNDYGDEREHLSVGFQIARGGPGAGDRH